MPQPSDVAALRQQVEQLSAENAALRRRLEGVLQKVHMFDALMDHIPHNVYFKDTQHRFLAISRHMADYFHVASPEDVIGKTDFDIFTSEHAQGAHDDEKRIMDTRESIVDLEERETWSDAHESWVDTTKVPFDDDQGNLIGIFGISLDITERKRLEQERHRAVAQLQQALTEVKRLSGLLPTCARCHRVRDDHGFWQRMEKYIVEHSEARITHSYCPDCLADLFPDEFPRGGKAP